MNNHFTDLTQHAINVAAKYSSEESIGVIINNPIKYAAFREGYKTKAAEDAAMYGALKDLSDTVERLCPIGSDPALFDLLVSVINAKEAMKNATSE